MCLSSWFYNNDDEDFGYYELVEPKAAGQVSKDASNLVRQFRVAWPNVGRFLDDLLGYAYVPCPRPTNNFSRVLPDEHPIYQKFYAMEATVEGLGQPTYNIPPGETGSSSSVLDNACCNQIGKECIAYPYARITATYKPADFNVLCDSDIASLIPTGCGGSASTSEWARFCKISYQYSAQLMTLAYPMYFMTPIPPAVNGGVIQSGIGRALFDAVLTVTWLQVPADSYNPFVCPTASTIARLAGKVNQCYFPGDNFTPPPGCGGVSPQQNQTYPPGTVLFVGAEPKMRLPQLGEGGSGNNYYWDITYQFAIKNNGTATDGNAAGWNYFYNPRLPGASKWDLVVSNSNGTGQPLYQSDDLHKLFVI